VSSQAAEWNSSFSHPTRKIVVITSRLLSDAHRYILRCLSNHGTVSHCTVLTAISEVLRPYNNMLLVMPGLLLKFLTILLIIIIFMKLRLFVDKSILYVSTGTKFIFLKIASKYMLLPSDHAGSIPSTVSALFDLCLLVTWIVACSLFQNLFDLA
jgi:hypothetical protein